MNLWDIVSIHAIGGPGSGCDPEVAEAHGTRCGRPSSDSAEIVGRTKKGNPITQRMVDYIDSFKPIYDKVKKDLNFLNAYGDFSHRLKNVESLADTMVRKSKPLERMEDVIGVRLEAEVSIDELRGLIKRVKDVECKEESSCTDVDYLDKGHPDGMGYRAFHMIVSVNGRPVEVQIRTKNQGKFARWAHDDIYKGPYGSDKAVVEYAKKVSAVIYNMDNRKPVKPDDFPPCPASLKRDNKCFSMGLRAGKVAASYADQ